MLTTNNNFEFFWDGERITKVHAAEIIGVTAMGLKTRVNKQRANGEYIPSLLVSPPIRKRFSASHEVRAKKAKLIAEGYIADKFVQVYDPLTFRIDGVALSGYLAAGMFGLGRTTLRSRASKLARGKITFEQCFSRTSLAQPRTRIDLEKLKFWSPDPQMVTTHAIKNNQWLRVPL